jgi:hypothetical protein
VFKMKRVAGAAMLACTGALMACGDGSGKAPDAAVGTGTPSGSAASTPSVTPVVTSPPPTKAPLAPGGSATAGVLSGKREVTIVRVQAIEGGLSLDNGELLEVDDNSGRQLFVPTPLGGDKYLIKAYGTPNNHPANDEPACWQEYDPSNTEPRTVEGAVCDANNARQRFTIIAQGKGTYAISRDGAFLQFSPTDGLILEKLGDAPLLSTFRFNDNGPARRPAGG